MTPPLVRRVLVVDDSPLFRSLLRRILNADPSLTVVGEAADGEEAIAMALRLKPDVITMDIHMPVTDGIEAIRQIMQSDPRPIVIVTGTTDPGDVREAFQAIEAGAIGAVRKPPDPSHPDFAGLAGEIVRIVKLMSEVKVVKRRPRRDVRVPEGPVRPSRGAELVAIGASTGGPAALEVILKYLPRDLPAPVVIVQHISPGFEQGLVDWLQRASPLDVRLATGYRPLRAGEVIIAPTGKHLIVTKRATMFNADKPAVDGHRPSASALFSSVAASWGGKAVGVILTGMGRDGARGLVELKQAGGWVIAQDKDSSVVHGMAAAAIAAGASNEVLPLEAIPAAIVKRCGVPPRS